MQKKTYNTSSAFSDAIAPYGTSDSRLNTPAPAQQGGAVATGKSYIDDQGKPRRKQFRRDVDRPFQKSVHLDKATVVAINHIKEQRTINGELNNTVDDVIFDAIQHYIKFLDEQENGE